MHNTQYRFRYFFSTKGNTLNAFLLKMIIKTSYLLIYCFRNTSILFLMLLEILIVANRRNAKLIPDRCFYCLNTKKILLVHFVFVCVSFCCFTSVIRKKYDNNLGKGGINSALFAQDFRLFCGLSFDVNETKRKCNETWQDLIFFVRKISTDSHEP